jgi:hypothetical protein
MTVKRKKKTRFALSRSIYRVEECVTLPHRLYYALQALSEIQHVTFTKALFNLLEEFRFETDFEVFAVRRSQQTPAQKKMALELISEIAKTVEEYDPKVEGCNAYADDHRGKHMIKVVEEHGHFIRTIAAMSREGVCTLSKSKIYKYFLIQLEKRVEKWIYSKMLKANLGQDLNSWTDVEKVRIIMAQRHFTLEKRYLDSDSSTRAKIWIAIPRDSAKKDDKRYWGQSSEGKLEAIANAQKNEKRLQEAIQVERIRRPLQAARTAKECRPLPIETRQAPSEVTTVA